MRYKPEVPQTRVARDLIPADATIDALREAAASRTACPLYRNATQTVLRAPDEEARHREIRRFVEDLRKVPRLLR
jgi:hypothetical protein